MDTINELVLVSDGLFIFAATVCCFLKDCDVPFDDALSSFLPQLNSDGSLPYDHITTAGGTTWFLNQMYNGILSRSQTTERQRTSTTIARDPVKDLLGVIATLSEPLPTSSLAKLLNMVDGSINKHLSRLHSVVRVPLDKDLPVRLFHASF